MKKCRQVVKTGMKLVCLSEISGSGRLSEMGRVLPSACGACSGLIFSWRGLSLVLFLPRRMAEGHTTGVLVFSGRNGNPFGGDVSGYWVRDGPRGGVLFNHVAFFSKAGLVEQIRTKMQSESR